MIECKYCKDKVFEMSECLNKEQAIRCYHYKKKKSVANLIAFISFVCLLCFIGIYLLSFSKPEKVEKVNKPIKTIKGPESIYKF